MKHNTFSRTERISVLIRRTLAQIIDREIKDPRLPSFVTLVDVMISKDLRHAKVYFTLLTGDSKEAEAALNESASYLRTLLVREVQLRVAPALHFIYDHSIAYSSRLSRLIDAANSGVDDEQPAD